MMSLMKNGLSAVFKSTQKVSKQSRLFSKQLLIFSDRLGVSTGSVSEAMGSGSFGLIVPGSTDENSEMRRFLQYNPNNGSFERYLDCNPLPVPHGYACHGSAYGWVFLVGDELDTKLMNSFTGEEIQLPSVKTLPRASRNWIGINKWYVLKDVFSSDPSLQPAPLVMVIHRGHSPRLAYCKSGDISWTSLHHRHTKHLYEDVVFYNDQFYAISQPEYIMAYDIRRLTGDKDQSVKKTLIAPRPKGLDKHRGDLYLVVLDGELIKITRKILVCVDCKRSETARFIIWRFVASEHKWVKVESLGDNALFLGKNTSLRASEHPGCIPNVIYFTDSSIYKNQPFGYDTGVYKLSDQSIMPLSIDTESVMPPPVWVTKVPSYAAIGRSLFYKLISQSLVKRDMFRLGELHSIHRLFPLLHHVLVYPHAACIRAKTAKLVTTMVHNNPRRQQLVMGLHGLSYNFTSDPDATSRTKALGAISGGTHHHHHLPKWEGMSKPPWSLEQQEPPPSPSGGGIQDDRPAYYDSGLYDLPLYYDSDDPSISHSWKCSNYKFVGKLRTPRLPYFILALQSGRALNRWYGKEISLYSETFLIHGIYGEDIVKVHRDVIVNVLEEYDSQRLFEDTVLTDKLMKFWPNLEECTSGESDLVHNERFWKLEYGKHAGRFSLLQLPFFNLAIRSYEKVGVIVNILLIDCCGMVRADGRRELRVKEFLGLIQTQYPGLPSLHVHKKDGFQELRELKFYMDYKTEEIIDCPTFRSVDNSIDNSSETNYFGIQPYDSNLELYVV